VKAVWLSSTYYMDPKLDGCNAAVERMFTRLIAYAGNAETRGFLPKNVHKIVGLSSGFSAVSELVSREILEPVEGGGYYFKAWANWNGSGDKLLERREKDRERQRKARSKPAPMSRDKSRDVTPPEETREEKNKNESRDKASSVSDARASEVAETEKPGPPVAVDGWKLVKPHCGHFPQATRTALAHQAAAMLKQGIDADDISAGIERWLTKDLGPSQLPHLVTDIIRAKTRPVAAPSAQGDRSQLSNHDRKTLGWAEAAAAAKRSLGITTNNTPIPSSNDRPLLEILSSDIEYPETA
jgi:hypothetical protein